jgi:hypothetical protein
LNGKSAGYFDTAVAGCDGQRPYIVADELADIIPTVE